MIGCGVQQTRKVPSGVNRRSREERQGRNMPEGWQLRAEGRTTSCRTYDREWTRGIHVDGGAIFEIQSEAFSPERGRSGTYRKVRLENPIPGGTARSEMREQTRAKVTKAVLVVPQTI
jgi:hypothetical protein